MLWTGKKEVEPLLRFIKSGEEPKREEHGLRGIKVGLDKEWKERGHQVEALCCQSEGQFQSAVCIAAVQLEGNCSSSLLAGAPQNVPHPYQHLLQHPSPFAQCLGSYILNLFAFKFCLIHLNSGESVEAGHSLGPALDFSQLWKLSDSSDQHPD
ncbi:NUT family member 2A [Plecturocebus cupreus]